MLLQHCDSDTGDIFASRKERLKCLVCLKVSVLSVRADREHRERRDAGTAEMTREKSKHRIEHWKQSVIDTVYKEHDELTNDDVGNGVCVRKYFGDSSTLVWCDGSVIDGVETVSGGGVVTRDKSWVWPVWSGYLGSWSSVSSAGSPLHSVSGQFSRGAVSGVTVFRYCNDVSITVAIR